MRIACVGGGPAGLYLAILMKARDPEHDLTVFERNPRGVTHGWGVVFWNDLVEQLEASDPTTRERDPRELVQVERPATGRRRQRAGARGWHGYGIGRQRLLDILVERALGLGVQVEFESEIESTDALRADLIVACDGVNSRSVSSAASSSRPTPSSVGTSTSGWARPGFRRLHVRVRPHGSRLDLVSRLRFRRRHEHVHRRVLAGDLDRARLRPARRARHHSATGADLRAAPRGPCPEEQGARSRPRGLAQVPDGHERELARRQHRAVGDAAHTTHFTIGRHDRPARWCSSGSIASLIRANFLVTIATGRRWAAP